MWLCRDGEKREEKQGQLPRAPQFKNVEYSYPLYYNKLIFQVDVIVISLFIVYSTYCTMHMHCITGYIFINLRFMYIYYILYTGSQNLYFLCIPLEKADSRVLFVASRSLLGASRTNNVLPSVFPEMATVKKLVKNEHFAHIKRSFPTRPYDIQWFRDVALRPKFEHFSRLPFH